MFGNTASFRDLLTENITEIFYTQNYYFGIQKRKLQKNNFYLLHIIFFPDGHSLQKYPTSSI